MLKNYIAEINHNNLRIPWLWQQAEGLTQFSPPVSDAFFIIAY